MNRKKIYQLIAIARCQLGYTPENHQYILQSFGASEKHGKISATTLSDSQLSKVLELYKNKGFEIKSNKSLTSKNGYSHNKINYIQYLLTRLGKDCSYADSLSKRMFKIDTVNWLSDYQCNAVIKSLRLQCQRQQIKL